MWAGQMASPIPTFQELAAEFSALLMGPEVVIRRVVPREPALQRGVRMGPLVSVDPLQLRMVDGELQPQVVGISHVQRHAVAVIGHAQRVAVGFEPLLNALLSLGVTLEGEMAGRAQIHGLLVLVGVLEERQSATVAEREEGVAILAAGGRRSLCPGGHQW